MTDPAFSPVIIHPVSIQCSTVCEFHVLRLDLVHPVISGNKWFKLKYYLQRAKQQEKTGIITFGGAYSNHLLATAAACHFTGIRSIGMVRGEEPENHSQTLLHCKNYGMQLIFLNRLDYRNRKIPATFSEHDYLLVDEGGFGEAGAKGISEIIQQHAHGFSHMVCAVGTGTTLAGLIDASVAPSVLGISVMKNNTSLEENVAALCKDHRVQWSINHDYHFGGYAKHPAKLLSFMNSFFENTGIPTDIVYTSKLFYGVEDLAQNGFFPTGSKVLIIHSGGIQGNNSLEKGTLIY